MLLALGVAGEAARLLTDYFGVSALPPVDAAAAGYTPPAAGGGPRTIDLLSIANAHLFGQRHRWPAEHGPVMRHRPANLPLVLAERARGGRPDEGLGDRRRERGCRPSVLAIGATLPGGARLHAVYADRIVIDRGGNLESLALPKQMLAGMPPPPVAQVNSPNEIAERMRQAIQQNPGALSNVIRPQPVFANGKLRGLRVYPGANRRPFRDARSATWATWSRRSTARRSTIRPAATEVMRTLGSEPVQVTVVRNGRQNDLVLDMAQVANEAQQIVGADGATPAEPAPPPGTTSHDAAEDEP